MPLLAGPNYTTFETVTVSGSAIGLTVATYGNSMFAFITLANAPIRFLVDGTTPTAAIGHLLNPGDVLELTSHDQIINFKAIRMGTVDGILSVSYGM